MSTYTIYSDGGAIGNPGPGGWGAYVTDGSHIVELGGSEPHTTNNRMELKATIEGLRVTPKNSEIKLHADSQYVINGITKWIFGWQKNGWRTADKKPVKNAELWQELLAAAAPHKIDWRWVKGHAGDPDNERADKLASDAALSLSHSRHW